LVIVEYILTVFGSELEVGGGGELEVGGGGELEL